MDKPLRKSGPSRRMQIRTGRLAQTERPDLMEHATDMEPDELFDVGDDANAFDSAEPSSKPQDDPL